MPGWLGAVAFLQRKYRSKAKTNSDDHKSSHTVDDAHFLRITGKMSVKTSPIFQGVVGNKHHQNMSNSFSLLSSKTAKVDTGRPENCR